MGLGWRRAFCTSIPRDRDPPALKEKQEKHGSAAGGPTPSPGSKFGFFSNPSTPRLQSQSVSSPSLRCRTTAASVNISVQSAPASPKLHCKTKNSPRFFHRSNPSSPRSPSTFSLLKSSLRLSKSRCGICLQSVKAGHGTAIFTAECSHSFHFPCIAAHTKKEGSLTCPVCSFTWKEMPLLSVHDHRIPVVEEKRMDQSAKLDIKTKNESEQQYSRSVLKVYNDDEPLMSPTSGARFNPIPESDENEDYDDVNGSEEFQGFFVNEKPRPIHVEQKLNSRIVEVSLLPEAAVVSIGRTSKTYVVVLKVKAPPAPAMAARRPPIDLVTVLDVSRIMTIEKLQMMKRAMRLVVSSLSASDRLSIVAFSATSKRLLPLRRMTTTGGRAARRIVDAIVALEGASSANDALKKAAKVLEDRRERNSAASIILMSDGQDDRSSTKKPVHLTRASSFVSTTRFSHFDFPVHSIALNSSCAFPQAPPDDAFAKFVVGLLSVMVQDLRLQLGFISGSAPADIGAVYSNTGRLVSVGSGSVRLGDLYAEEERELLVELKVPSSAVGAHHVLSVRSAYRDPSTQELVHCKEQALLVPRPHAVRSSTPTIGRLRNLFITTRAIAESGKLMDRNDLTGAHHMLSSARALLLQYGAGSADEFLRGLEAELAELQRRRQRRRTNTEREATCVDEKSEPLTPTSAWKAAERLAKVAIMRKSMNRVSDLHGFENARF